MSENATQEQIDGWLVEHCGKGLPYDNATDLGSALHGAAYTLRQIESAANYKVFIGQSPRKQTTRDGWMSCWPVVPVIRNMRGRP